MMKRKNQQSGFTLIEIAMVLGFVAIVMGFGMEALNSWQNINRGRDTLAKMEEIRQYLDDYALTNGFLPCPARLDVRPGAVPSTGTGFGEANCDVTSTGIIDLNNNVVAGTVPVRALNIREHYAGDAWGNKILYVVDRDVTNHAGGSWATGNGDITIRSGRPAPGGAYTDITTGAGYVLVSHGPNGGADNGGATAMKETVSQVCTANNSPDSRNCDLTNGTLAERRIFYTAPYNKDQTLTTGTTNNHFFDDFIMWRVAPANL